MGDLSGAADLRDHILGSQLGAFDIIRLYDTGHYAVKQRRGDDNHRNAGRLRAFDGAHEPPRHDGPDQERINALVNQGVDCSDLLMRIHRVGRQSRDLDPQLGCPRARCVTHNHPIVRAWVVGGKANVHQWYLVRHAVVAGVWWLTAPHANLNRRMCSCCPRS